MQPMYRQCIFALSVYTLTFMKSNCNEHRHLWVELSKWLVEYGTLLMAKPKCFFFLKYLPQLSCPPLGLLVGIFFVSVSSRRTLYNIKSVFCPLKPKIHRMLKRR